MAGSTIVGTKEIGDAAGLVWKFLDQNGPTSVNGLVVKLGITKELTLQAVGWLAREGKLSFERATRGRLIRLVNQ